MTPERFDFGVPLVDAKGNPTGERAVVTLHVTGYRRGDGLDGEKPIWDGVVAKVFAKNAESPDVARAELVRHLRTIADALDDKKKS